MRRGGVRVVPLVFLWDHNSITRLKVWNKIIINFQIMFSWWYYYYNICNLKHSGGGKRPVRPRWPVQRSHYYGSYSAYFAVRNHFKCSKSRRINGQKLQLLQLQCASGKQQVAPRYAIYYNNIIIPRKRFFVFYYKSITDLTTIMRRGGVRVVPLVCRYARATPISFMMPHNIIFGRRRSGSRGPPQPVRKPPSRHTNYFLVSCPSVNENK